MRNFLLFFLIPVISVPSSLAQNWESLTALPGPGRHHPVCFVLDDMAYYLTGTTDSQGGTNDFYQYNPNADSWTTLDNFPGPARSYSYGDVSDGKAYMGFGLSTFDTALNDLWEFDPETGQWSQLASCPCSGRLHPTFTIESGKLFVGQGNGSFGNMNDWWAYDIASNTWEQLPDLPGLPRHHPYHFAVGGAVYTGLGHGNGPGTNIYDDWFRWDLETESWQQMSDFPDQGRVAGTQFSIGDRGFVLSGDGDDHFTMATGEFWEYDFVTDTWVQLTPHPGVSRWAPGSFTVGNMVYFTSGQVRAGNPNPGLKNDLWKFDLDEFVSVERLTGLNEKVTLYPNPAGESIRINGLNNFSEVFLEVYSTTGKLVKSERFQGGEIHLSELITGLYFMSIQADGQLIDRVKFVKQ